MKPIVILITGYISSGKDTIANHLLERYSSKNLNVCKIALADKLKLITQRLIKLFYDIDIDLGDFYDQEAKERQRYNMPHTLRTLLQIVGSDIFRDMLWKDIWCDVISKDISLYDIVIISDWRFPNELHYFHNLYLNSSIEKYITIRVNRVRHHVGINNMIHQSEEHIDKLNVMYDIDNNGSLEDLYRQLDILF